MVHITKFDVVLFLQPYLKRRASKAEIAAALEKEQMYHVRTTVTYTKIGGFFNRLTFDLYRPKSVIVTVEGYRPESFKAGIL